MLATLIQRYDKKNKKHFIWRTRDYWNFTGCQVLHFILVLMPYTYQFTKPSFDNRMYIFEEYGAFNNVDRAVKQNKKKKKKKKKKMKHTHAHMHTPQVWE